MKYIALLRGINVGGNNKVPMARLKACFESLGFANVATYINSGNVLFDSPEELRLDLIDRCERTMLAEFGFTVTCTIISSDELRDALSHAPEWWGLANGDKNDVLFVIPPKTPAEVMSEIGETKPEYERVASHGSLIFWTAPLKTFGRTRYGKVVGTSAYKSITIRNSNTVKKLAGLAC